jgi:hypothetical protein
LKKSRFTRATKKFFASMKSVSFVRVAMMPIA